MTKKEVPSELLFKILRFLKTEVHFINNKTGIKLRELTTELDYYAGERKCSLEHYRNVNGDCFMCGECSTEDF